MVRLAREMDEAAEGVCGTGRAFCYLFELLRNLYF